MRRYKEAFESFITTETWREISNLRLLLTKLRVLLTAKIDLFNSAETSEHFLNLPHIFVQGGSNMTGTDLCVNKPHCAAAVRP